MMSICAQIPARRQWFRGWFSFSVLAGVLCFWTAAFGAERLTLNFNPDWKFIKADPSGAANADFDDHAWATVSTPHTFNDTDTFDDWSPPGHRGECNQWSGRTWYRKTFTLPESFQGKKVFIEFEAARQFAEVYLNGRLLGISRNGFLPFGFDLTPGLRFGAPNVLAVMCDNRFMSDPLPGQNKNPKTKGENGLPSLAEISARVNAAIPESVDEISPNQLPWNNPHWHPAHGGLYRNVRLYVTDPVHISLPLYSFLQTAGPYVYATDISPKSARIGLEVPIQNEGASTTNASLTAQIIDPNGLTVLELQQAGTVPPGGSIQLKLAGTLPNPRFWEPSYPWLYRVVCSLRISGEVVDTCELPLGIRTAEWSAHTGLALNGKPLKLHGWGQKPTDEWPGLGAAQPDWLHFYTVELMKAAGGNFIRWGHCAGPPASIAAADRLGLIVDQPGVDGESDTRGAAWTIRASAFRDAIIYYRNHPSILIWEGGNQKVSREHARELSSYVAQYDPHGGRAYAHRRPDQTTAQFMQVAIGTEGGREISSLPVVEGEYDREESPRRVWDSFSPPEFGYPEAKGQTYQLTSEQYAVNQVAQFWGKLGAADHCGGANWIFSDSTSGGRLACEVTRASGEVDGVRLPKQAYYVCQAMFRPDPQVHIIGHWTYPAGTKKTVYVASNGQDTELFLNGKSLGHGTVSDRFLFAFPDVTWEPGEIRAVAYRDGQKIAEEVKKTAGSPVALRLTPLSAGGCLRADGADIALIDVEAVDAQGQRCPTFQQTVSFEFAGPGTWRGGYNSGKTNSINRTTLDLDAGVNRVAIRASRVPGTLSLTARCPGLQPATVKISSTEFPATNGFSTELPWVPAISAPKSVPSDFVDATLGSQPVARSNSPPCGRYVRAFAYSGPALPVQLQQDARDGKRIYVDRDYFFSSLPRELTGADWVQAANADKLYAADDLMEIAVPAEAIVSVAHDDRLSRPAWLSDQFQPSRLTLTIDGRPMTIFQRRVQRAESLTLGGNTTSPRQKACNMYVVFVNAPAHLSVSTDGRRPGAGN